MNPRIALLIMAGTFGLALLSSLFVSPGEVPPTGYAAMGDEAMDFYTYKNYAPGTDARRILRDFRDRDGMIPADPAKNLWAQGAFSFCESPLALITPANGTKPVSRYFVVWCEDIFGKVQWVDGGLLVSPNPLDDVRKPETPEPAKDAETPAP